MMKKKEAVTMKQVKVQNSSSTSQRVTKSTRVQRAAEEVLRKYNEKYSQPQSIQPHELSWLKTPSQSKKSA